VNYRVYWRKKARTRLADIWVAAPDRNAITAAAHRIDQLLERNPLGCGESRDKGRRILYALPLVVMYRIIEDDKKVIVLDVGAK
jgi:hypothetical protein